MIQINETNIVYNNGSLYLFYNDITANLSFNVYLSTNIIDLISNDIITIYIVKFNDISNIKKTDIYANINLFKKWSDANYATFGTDYNLNQQLVQRNGGALIHPHKIINSLKRNGGALIHPHKIVKNDSNNSFTISLIA